MTCQVGHRRASKRKLSTRFLFRGPTVRDGPRRACRANLCRAPRLPSYQLRSCHVRLCLSCCYTFQGREPRYSVAGVAKRSPCAMEGAGLRPAAAFRAHITGGTRRAVISFARRINDVGHDNGWAQRARDLAQSAGEAADRRPGMARKRTRRPKKAGTERNEEAEEDVHAARPSPAASTSAPSPPSDPPLAQQRTHTPPGRGSVALTKADIDALAQQDVDDAEHSIMRLWPEWFDSLEPSGEARPTPTEAVALMRALGASSLKSPALRRDRLSRDRCVQRLLLACHASGDRDGSLQSLQPHDLASLVWAMAAMGGASAFGTETERALGAIQEQRGWRGLGTRQLCDVVWALARSRHWSPHLGELARLLGDRARGLTPGQVTSAMWGFASLGYTPNAFLRAVDWPGVCQSASFKQVASLAWSAAVVGQAGAAIGHAALRRLCGLWDPATSQEPSPMHQAHMAMEAARADGGDLPSHPSIEPLSRAARAAWEQHLQTHVPRPSRYQEYVRRALIYLGVRAFTEEDTSSGLSIDVAIPDIQVAVEIDGPSHFARTTGSPLGHAILKHRLLRAKGWRVVSLSHTTLDQCGGHQDIAAVLRPSLAAAFQENGISF